MLSEQRTDRRIDVFAVFLNPKDLYYSLNSKLRTMFIIAIPIISPYPVLFIYLFAIHDDTSYNIIVSHYRHEVLSGHSKTFMLIILL